MKKKVKEKWFICPNCASLETWTHILKEIENAGSVGMCYCEFNTNFWSDTYYNFDTRTDRIFNDYMRISESNYKALKSEKNEVLRLRMFNTIPKNKRV